MKLSWSKPSPVAAAAFAAVSTLAVAGLAAALAVQAADAPKPGAAAPARPALTVSVVQPQTAALPQIVSANGSLHAWQEASIGAEASGLRIAELRVNVGDRVRRGQVLATFAGDTVRAELAQMRATVAEAEANAAEAAANAQRARELAQTGALSAQQINQFLTAERTAQARLEAQRAMARVQELRLAQTEVRAPDDGVISSRSATLGAVVPAGQELFRLIRQGRLEWRAEVAANELSKLRPGQKASVQPAGAGAATGTVRTVAPTLDATTRNGLVYVDLPPAAAAGGAKAGMFARGEFEVGRTEGLVLPQSAVLLRDGFANVFVVGPDSKVAQRKVELGVRLGDRVQVKSGVEPGARVVAAGGAFLADGDLVKVVQAAPAGPAVQAGQGAPK